MDVKNQVMRCRLDDAEQRLLTEVAGIGKPALHTVWDEGGEKAGRGNTTMKEQGEAMGNETVDVLKELDNSPVRVDTIFGRYFYEAWLRVARNELQMGSERALLPVRSDALGWDEG